MNLTPLSGLFKVAGATVQGYGEDRQDAIKELLQQNAAKRQATQDAIENRVKLAGIDPEIQRALSGAKAQGEVQPHIDTAVGTARALAPIDVQKAVDTAKGVEPIHVQQAVDTAKGTAPVAIDTHNKEQEHDAANPTASFSPVVTTAPGGAQHVSTLNTKTGALTDTGVGAKGAPGGGTLAAPIALRVGQFGEMLKKAHDLAGANESLNVGMGQSAAEDVAEHGVHIPLLGTTIPGTKGIGSAIVNHSPDYATYQAALTPFVLAAGHAMAGARVSDTQLQQIRNGIEMKPGDFNNPSVRAQKERNMIDLINSIGGSLPKSAIAEQEAQMEEQALAGLVGRGYKRVGGAAPSADHAHLSDADFAKQYRAGAFNRPP